MSYTDETYDINVFSASAYVAPVYLYFATTASLLLQEHCHLSTRKCPFVYSQSRSAPPLKTMVR